MCGMGHADGECSWARAAGAAGIIFMVPNLSSRPFEEILASREPGQVVWFQIYVNPSREVVLEQLRACEKYKVRSRAFATVSLCVVVLRLCNGLV
jgi:L-lactate dehydrogenase (cytochrome)